MRFISKYRKYAITIKGKRYAFAPEGPASIYATTDEGEISELKSSPAFGRDYAVAEGSKGKKSGD